MRFDSAIANAALIAGTNDCGNGSTPPPVTAPFPWITVLDPYGAILSSRVAAVVILPGPVTSRQPGSVKQSRSATALPTAYLDTVDNSACPGGRCDNALLNTSPSTAPMTFIQCVNPSTTVGDPRFSTSYACNDRLVYITVDELFNVASQRMEREFVRCLNEYAGIYGKYPWAAPSATLISVDNQSSGSFPSSDSSSPSINICLNVGGYWQGWQRAAVYTVASNQHTAQIFFATRPRAVSLSLP